MQSYLKKIKKKYPALGFLKNSIINIYNQFGSKAKWQKIAKQKIIKLELGSWKKYGSHGWTTIDLVDSDICWDLRRGILLPDNSVDIIYSSHLLEHIEYEDIIVLLTECRRVLKESGELSVSVPDFRLYVDAYIKGELFRPKETWWLPASIDTNSAIDQLNYVAYMGSEHKYLFDNENLINTLLKAGFSSASLRDFDKNIDPEERRFESIYARAKK